MLFPILPLLNRNELTFVIELAIHVNDIRLALRTTVARPVSH